MFQDKIWSFTYACLLSVFVNLFFTISVYKFYIRTHAISSFHAAVMSPWSECFLHSVRQFVINVKILIITIYMLFGLPKGNVTYVWGKGNSRNATSNVSKVYNALLHFPDTISMGFFNLVAELFLVNRIEDAMLITIKIYALFMIYLLFIDIDGVTRKLVSHHNWK